MDDSILERLDERTDNLIKIVDKHVEEDKKKFEKIFDWQGEMDKNMAKGAVIVAIISIAANALIGAWIKGIFG